MNKSQIIQSIERPQNMSETDELAWALSQVLQYPTPQGQIREYHIPAWLSDIATGALLRYLGSSQIGFGEVEKVTPSQFNAAMVRLKNVLDLKSDRLVAEVLGIPLASLEYARSRSEFPIGVVRDLAEKMPDLQIDPMFILRG